MHVDGACYCGRISFTAEVDPAKTVICHCADCQVFSGSPFRAVVTAPIETFRLRGEPKYFEKTADSGNKRRQAFCGECGSALFGIAPENATSVTLRLGCLKQRDQLVPTAEIWKRSQLGWLGRLGHLPESPDHFPLLVHSLAGA